MFIDAWWWSDVGLRQCYFWDVVRIVVGKTVEHYCDFFFSNVFNIGLKKHFPVLNIRSLMFEPHAIIILELVPSIVIFWTYLNCWRKSYSNKATLLLGWSQRYKNYTVVITIGMTVMKYPYLKWQWIFYFFSYMFSFLYHCRDIYQTWLYIWVTRRVSYKKQELPALRENPSSSRILLRFVLLILLVFFVLCYYVSLRSEFCVVMSVTISA